MKLKKKAPGSAGVGLALSMNADESVPSSPMKSPLKR